MTDPAGLLAKAVERHRRGELAEAERLYRAVLARVPEHAGALHRFGLVCAQQGRLDEAAASIGAAVRADPAVAAAHNDLGAVLKLLGRPDDAVAAYQAALACAPGFAAAHYNLGAALQALGRLEPAIEQFRLALAADPGLAGAHGDLAVALAAAGRLDEAAASAERAVALAPDDRGARINLGKILQALGRNEAALACLEVALERGPGSADLHARVGILQVQLGRLEAGCAALRRALAVGPESAALHCNLAVALLALGQAEAAIASFERALALDDRLAAAHNGLGNALQTLDQRERSLACYHAALALRPGYVEAHNNLGIALAALGRHQEALECYRTALGHDPESVEGHNNLGTALAALGREDDALAAYDQALARAPEHVGALVNAGNALKALGRLDAARAVLERALALDPRVPRALHALAECGPVVRGDPLWDALAALARQPETVAPAERVYLHFALAKAQADVGDHAAAFEQLRAGNALKRSSIVYDEAAMLAGLERVRAVFTPARMAALAGGGLDDARPVFVVGMPRSGTTLVEQILASHPLVFGAGELEAMPGAIAALSERIEGTYPDLLDTIDAAALRALGADYLAAVAPLAPAAARITDKLPLNFCHVGMIHLALPAARIVHVRRDPLDTCLSCFERLFTGSQPFTYELGELGRYYRAYEATMAHWRAVLPAGVMLEVDYEDVVADLEGQARRLVDHCGLAWDDACRAFDRAKRPVRTASVVQVRQKLYRSAIGRAERYRAQLGPLRQALGSAD